MHTLHWISICHAPSIFDCLLIVHTLLTISDGDNARQPLLAIPSFTVSILSGFSIPAPENVRLYLFNSCTSSRLPWVHLCNLFICVVREKGGGSKATFLKGRR